jgi:hypothetical protein
LAHSQRRISFAAYLGASCADFCEPLTHVGQTASRLQQYVVVAAGQVAPPRHGNLDRQLFERRTNSLASYT